jgi:hypothetical protein
MPPIIALNTSLRTILTGSWISFSIIYKIAKANANDIKETIIITPYDIILSYYIIILVS